jgi:hypothetical protein
MKKLLQSFTDYKILSPGAELGLLCHGLPTHELDHGAELGNEVLDMEG